MNYRHAYHAGNFADVAKHLALIAVLLHLRKKDAPFAAIDTHAGRGVYDLTGEEARRTGEGGGGVLRLQKLDGGPPVLSAYLDLARDSKAYPGSPLIAAKLLRPKDRLVAIEKHPEDVEILSGALRGRPGAWVERADGYARLAGLLPPPERRAAILIDPPYEAEDEFALAAQAFAKAHRRFATGIYIVWFPAKSRARADAFCSEMLAAGVRRALRFDVATRSPAEDRLAAAGLFIANPPYRFEDEMRAALAPVLPLMEAEARFAWLAGAG